jgi:hypothetical protein
LSLYHCVAILEYVPLHADLFNFSVKDISTLVHPLTLMFFVVHCRNNAEKIILLGNRSKEEILYETKGGESATAQSVSVCKTRKSEGLTVIYGPIPRCKQRPSAKILCQRRHLEGNRAQLMESSFFL